MIAIVDYDTGNLRSVKNALSRIGAEYEVTSDHQKILGASHVLLPGVGEASSAMEKLRARRLDTLIPSLTQPVMGICIGLQLMCKSSAEGNARCMGIFPADVELLIAPAGSNLKIPHVGWDTVKWDDLNSPLVEGIPDNSYFYYVHSYAANLCENTFGVTDYCIPFSAVLKRDNFFATQFHPEKSGAMGERLLSNFLSLTN